MKKDSKAAVSTQKSATKKPKSSTTRKTRTSTKKTDKTPKSLEESTPAINNVFNIDNTNIKEIKPDLYQSLLDKFKPEDGIKYDAAGMYSNKALDRMFERQEWVCPIHISAKNDGTR
nr:hypothetical protein [uncultured Prevotella sp.]